MDRQEWLAQRKSGITGTDIAAIAGLTKWKTPLDVWYEKRGLAEPTPENDAMRWGTLQEPLIADFYAEKHGVTLVEPGLMRHKDYTWCIGTPDRLIAPDNKVLEIKTANRFMADQWGEVGSDDIPQNYFAQCQWYLILTGYKECDVAVKIDSSDYREYTVHANTAIQRRLLDIAEAFWRDNVVGGEEPLDGERNPYHSEYLDKIEVVDNMKSFNEDTIRAARAYDEADAAYKVAEAKKDSARAAVEALIGDASGIEGAGYKFTWKRNKPSAKTDWAAVAQEASAYIPADAYKSLVERFTATKPGSRVFRFKRSI